MAVPARELHRVVLSAVVYNNEGRYLIAKRGEKKIFPGKWHVPGGGISRDDYENLPSSTPTQKQWYGALEVGLRRELKEELNIEVGEPKYITNVAFVRPDDVAVVVLSFYAPYVSGEVKVDGEENVDWKWVTLEEAKSYDLIEGIWHEMEVVDKILHHA
jgi:8-oxo-dGTP pyrophosphatase MutT (NUDIX family)